MFHISRYTEEFRIKLVAFHLMNPGLSLEEVSARYGISVPLIINWEKAFEHKAFEFLLSEKCEKKKARCSEKDNNPFSEYNRILLNVPFLEDTDIEYAQILLDRLKMAEMMMRQCRETLLSLLAPSEEWAVLEANEPAGGIKKE